MSYLALSVSWALQPFASVSRVQSPSGGQAHVSSSSHFDVKQRTTPHPVYHEMVDLVLMSSIRSSSSEFVDVAVREYCSSDDHVVERTPLCQPLPIVIL